MKLPPYKCFTVLALLPTVLMAPAATSVPVPRGDSLALPSILRAAAPPPAFASNLFTRVSASLVMITAGASAGSGFVMTMNGRRYLVTNEHITRGGRPFTARLLNGTELVLGPFEVAQNRDLARFALDPPGRSGGGTAAPALELQTVQPALRAPVAVFGNSDGGGVATAIYGAINGVGPDAVETDAEFVHGNSGSPLLDAEGKVLGVTTYATLNADPQDWVKKDTRFAKVRRFAVRLENVDWLPMKWEDYIARVEALQDLTTFCVHLARMDLDDGTWIRPEPLYYDDRYRQEFVRFIRFHAELLAISRTHTAAALAIAARERNFNGFKNRLQDNQYSMSAVEQQRLVDRTERDQRSMQGRINELWNAYLAARKRALVDTRSLAGANNWQSKRLESDARWLLGLINYIDQRAQDNHMAHDKRFDDGHRSTSDFGL